MAEIYPLAQNQEQRMTDNMKYGGNTRLIRMGGNMTTIYAVGSGGTQHVQVWNHEEKKWAIAASEYQLKTARSISGVLAVSRDLVC